MVLKNTTFNLPDDLVARAKAYAAAHGTTMTAIVREHLEAVLKRCTLIILDAGLFRCTQSSKARAKSPSPAFRGRGRGPLCAASRRTMGG